MQPSFPTSCRPELKAGAQLQIMLAGVYFRLLSLIFTPISMSTKKQPTLHFLNLSLLPVLVFCAQAAFAQNYLGHNREEVLLSFPQCTVADKYETMVVFNCSGQRSVFYFQAENKLCDLYAAEMDASRANDTLQSVQKNGYKLLETRYVEPFLVSKKNNHQKFPARVYSNGKYEYCFMPISLTGKTAELNTVIVRQMKKKAQ